MSNHPETLQRAEHNKANPYAQIRRDMLQDRDLSFEARGLLGYLLSKPNDWTIIISDLQQNCGRDKVRRVIKELIAAHYIKERTKIIDDKTKRITGYTPHLIYEVKADNPEYNPLTEKPLTESQRTGFHDTAKRPLHNKDIQNKEEKNKETTLPEQNSGGDDSPLYTEMTKEQLDTQANGYAEKDFTIAIETIWLAHNKTGATPIDDEMAKAMFTDDEYLEVIASAKHQYNARINGLAKLVSELPEITPKSERDELAAQTMELVQREKERQAKIQAKADADAMKEAKKAKDAKIVLLIKAWSDSQKAEQAVTGNLYGNKYNRTVMGALLDKGLSEGAIQRFVKAKASSTFFVSMAYLNNGILGFLEEKKKGSTATGTLSTGLVVETDKPKPVDDPEMDALMDKLEGML